MAPRKLWTPPEPASTNMDKFRRLVNQNAPGLTEPIADYNQLHAWSVTPDTAPEFWRQLFIFEELKKGTVPKQAYAPVLDASGGVQMYPSPKFFEDVRLNFAEHIFQDRAPSDVAIIACQEGGAGLKEITWADLRRQTQEVAAALVQAGVGVGDRVAAVITNCPETIVACLATLSLGAIWSTVAPDMGVSGIMERLDQIRPAVVIFETSVVYNSRVRDQSEKNAQLVSSLHKTPEFRLAVAIERSSRHNPDILPPKSTKTWSEFRVTQTGGQLTFKRMPFSHPGFIVYSSGTTGVPKCIVHSACGLLMQVKKDYMLHLDVRPGDTIYQYTTTGWIMWAMVLCGLSYGGKILIYDGSPLVPDPMVTLRLCSKFRVSLFGTSARFLSDLKKKDIRPRELCDMSALRTVSSTGSVLETDVCEWFYDYGFPKNVHLSSGSGGTDLACALVNGSPVSPLYAGEIQVPALGMAIDVLDYGEREPVSVKSSGEPGELVCRMPFPSQPIAFWGLEQDGKYKSAYFEMFGTCIWNQGDFIQCSPETGGFNMMGRSDGVLNPSGVRFGSAEIYNVTSKIEEFEDTLCVGQRRPHDGDERVLLFAKMKPGLSLGQDLMQRTKRAIQVSLSPRHVPAEIFQVEDVPYTTNGKKMEVMIKNIVCGRKVKPSGAVANPECLHEYQRFYKIEDEAARQARTLSKL